MLTVVDYGLGNIASVIGAIEKLNFSATISSNEDVLLKSDHLILPGVGAFKDGMQNLQDLNLISVLNHIVIEKKVPILGICLGAQLMMSSSDEFGEHKGLDWVPGQVRRLTSKDPNIRVPHVGWNEVSIKKQDPLFSNIKEKDPLLYFVHSHAIYTSKLPIIGATCDHGENFIAAFSYENIFGTQFHPEKSQKTGLKILKNFLSVDSQNA